jgi:hypothetical protein
VSLDHHRRTNGRPSVVDDRPFVAELVRRAPRACVRLWPP